MITRGLGSFEILEPFLPGIHLSLAFSLSLLDSISLNLCVSLCLLQRGIQGILITYFYSFLLLFLLRLVYFWAEKSARFVRRMEEGGQFLIHLRPIIFEFIDLRNFWIFLVCFFLLSSFGFYLESRRIKSSQFLPVSKVRHSVTRFLVSPSLSRIFGRFFGTRFRALCFAKRCRKFLDVFLSIPFKRARRERRF